MHNKNHHARRSYISDSTSLLNAQWHEALKETAAFKKVKKSCTQRGQVRRVWISLSKELKNVYCDDEENLQFQDEYLEEIIEKTEDEEQPLIKLLEQLLQKDAEKSEGKKHRQIS